MIWGQITLTDVIKLNYNGDLSNGLNTWDSVSHLNPFLPDPFLFSGELQGVYRIIQGELKIFFSHQGPFL
jgi:hypothetical protein